MKISIVVPVFNVADYLKKCVDSLLMNDCSDCEIILVDDGSTDMRSGAMCDEYAEKNPGLVKVIHKTNGGLGDARNAGVGAARGDYVLFIDGDDHVTPDMLTRLKDAADRFGSDMILFNLMREDGDRIEKISPPHEYPPEKVLTLSGYPELLFTGPSAVTKLLRREFLNRTGIVYPSRVWYEDVRTTLKLMALSESIVYLPDYLYYYVVREGSITRNVNVARNHEIIEAFDDLIGWYRSEGFFSQYEDELCKLAVDHVLLAASVRVIRAEVDNPLVEELCGYVGREFPDYRNNPYFRELSKSHKLLVRLLENKKYRMVRALFSIKNHLN